MPACFSVSAGKVVLRLLSRRGAKGVSDSSLTSAWRVARGNLRKTALLSDAVSTPCLRHPRLIYTRRSTGSFTSRSRENLHLKSCTVQFARPLSARHTRPLSRKHRARQSRAPLPLLSIEIDCRSLLGAFAHRRGKVRQRLAALELGVLDDSCAMRRWLALARRRAVWPCPAPGRGASAADPNMQRLCSTYRHQRRWRNFPSTAGTCGPRACRT